MLPQFRIQCVCALTPMNASFEQNLSATAQRRRNARLAAAESQRRTRQVLGTGPFRPDEQDMGIGRERPPSNWTMGRRRGTAEGVAHAPLVSDSNADSGTDDDTGGTERRPVYCCELAEMKGHRRITLSGDHADTARASDGEPRESEGERCSRVCVPPSFSSLFRILPASRGTRSGFGSVSVDRSRRLRRGE